MKRPVARTLRSATETEAETRAPRAFAPQTAIDVEKSIEPIIAESTSETLTTPPPRLLGWLGKLVWITAGALLSLALGLAAENLIRELFAAAPWLGWLGFGILALFVAALLALIIREALAVGRLRSLDRLRHRAEAVLVSDRATEAKVIVAQLRAIYAARPDLARGRQMLESSGEIFDGGEIIRYAERSLMAELDARARTLTAASARRVALVTTVSPRALVDIAFVVFESVRLGGQIARLYGARPGIFGTWRLLGAILSHLAVTGGLVLTDGVMEQLVGQGLVAKLSARLGEGIVNGLMTVRVGIAAMRVVRPLPFETQRQPKVKDFIPELANVLQEKAN
ncbi:MAG TPA: TIGR01620 family protein [Devosia sp.]